LATDVAELLASTSLTCGPARAVAAAQRALGDEALAAALPRLQPAVLSSATRRAVAARKPLLDDLRAETIRVAGVDDVHDEQIERVTPSRLLTLGFLVGFVYFIFPALAELSGVGEALRTANYWWFPVIVVMSAVTYLGATISLAGAVEGRLAPGRTLLAQFASSFANRFTPAGAGGYAVNVRYLQKTGTDSAAAVGAVGLTTVAGLSVHILLIVVFLLWAGSKANVSYGLPAHTILLVVLVLGGLVGLAFAIRPTRNWIHHTVVPAMRRSIRAIGRVAARPAKLAALFGGAFTVTLGYLAAFIAAVAAVGGGPSVAQLGVVYLIGSAVAAAIPVPGGLGPTEAALYGGLVSAGMAGGPALSAVLLFRLGTYWLPIIPGWLSYRHLRNHDAL
jgi:undecaprenyl-diphosphatase